MLNSTKSQKINILICSNQKHHILNRLIQEDFHTEYQMACTYCIWYPTSCVDNIKTSPTNDFYNRVPLYVHPFHFQLWNYSVLDLCLECQQYVGQASFVCASPLLAAEIKFKFTLCALILNVQQSQLQYSQILFGHSRTVEHIPTN